MEAVTNLLRKNDCPRDASIVLSSIKNSNQQLSNQEKLKDLSTQRKSQIMNKIFNNHNQKEDG